MEELTYKVELFSLEPEMTIIEQYDQNNKSVFFSGVGSVIVYKNVDAFTRVLLGTINPGKIINERSAVFDTTSTVLIKSKSYCTMGTID